MKKYIERELHEFNGQFDISLQSNFVLEVVSSFLDMILQGTNINENKKYLEQANLTIPQLIRQNIMSRARDNTTKNYFCKTREFPLGIHMGMMVNAKTQKKRILRKHD